MTVIENFPLSDNRYTLFQQMTVNDGWQEIWGICQFQYLVGIHTFGDTRVHLELVSNRI
jgi:hypothetical protein